MNGSDCPILLFSMCHHIMIVVWTPCWEKFWPECYVLNEHRVGNFALVQFTASFGGSGGGGGSNYGGGGGGGMGNRF